MAIHETWHHHARAHTDAPSGGFHSPHRCDVESGELPEPIADTGDVADQIADRIEHNHRFEDLATIKPKDRRALYLKGLGYTYQEIMQITGATYTAGNRRITEGRPALRQLEHDCEHSHSAERMRGRRTPPPP